MATRHQRAAVDKLVEQGGKSVSRAMRESRIPYSIKTAKTPSKLTESKGFQEILKEYGLTSGLIAKSLVDDINGKPKKRYAELNLGAEILGMKKQEGGDTKTQINVIIVDKEIAERYGHKDTNS